MNDVLVTLQGESYSIVSGVSTPTVTNTVTVWAKHRKATRKEFYEADKAGHKVTDEFFLFTFEYADEAYLTCDGKQYSVVRVYKDEPDVVQLSCEVRL